VGGEEFIVPAPLLEEKGETPRGTAHGG